MKKILSVIAKGLVVLLLSTCFVGTSSAFASTNAMSMEELQKTHNLRTIDLNEIPDNVEPLQFDTIEEANEFLLDLEAESQTIDLTNGDTQYGIANSIMARSATQNGYQTKVVVRGGTANINLAVNYTYANKRFISCTGVNGYMSGITIGNGYTQHSSSYSIIDGRRTLAAHSYGTQSYYIILEGIGQIASKSRDLYAEFYL